MLVYYYYNYMYSYHLQVPEDISIEEMKRGKTPIVNDPTVEEMMSIPNEVVVTPAILLTGNQLH